MDNNELRDRLARLNLNMLDISEAVDQHTKAIISIYQAIEAIAQHQNIKLPKPLCNMTLEENLINRSEDIEGEVVDSNNIRVINYERD